MKHSRKLMLLIVLLMAALSAQALYVEIGEGTSTTYYSPVTGLWDYGWSRTIFLADELGTAMDITGLSLQVSNSAALDYTFANQSIYLVHTADAEFTDPSYLDPETAGYTLVRNGDITFTGTDWIEIQFDNAFSYNGTDNLILCWVNNDGDWDSDYPVFYYTYISGRCLYDNQDTTFPQIDGAISGYVPNIRFHYTIEGAPEVASDPNPGNGAEDVPTDLSSLSWTFGANTNNFDVYFGTDNPPTTLIADNQAAFSPIVSLEEELLAETDYYWKVISRNSIGEVSGPVWSFKTEDVLITEFPYGSDFDVFPPAYFDLTGGTRNWARYSSNGITAAYCNLWSWEEGNTAYMKLPHMTLPESPALTFNWSHFYNDEYLEDALTVQISTDDGETWTNLWYKEGVDLDSNDGAGNTSPGDFSTIENISLNDYTGQTVEIRFYALSGYGPNLYVDNVYVYSTGTPPGHVTAVSPEDGEEGVLLDGTLQWSAAFGAEGYSLSFGTDNPPTNIVNNADQGENTTYAFENLDINTVYYWQVVPYNGGGNAVDCPVFSFTSIAVPLPASAVAPTNYATEIPNAGTLEWSDAYIATGYKLFLGTDDPPTDIVNGTDLGEATTYNFSDLDLNTTYYWQVVPYNGNGDAVDCPVWRFTTFNLPEVTDYKAPREEELDVPESGVLVWDEIDADGYCLFFGTDNPPTNVVNGSDLGLDNYYQYQNLALNTTYYWQVVPYNAAGNAIECPIWSFTTVATSSNFGTDGTYYFANSISDGAAPSYPTYNWIDTTDHTELVLNGSSPDNGSADDGNWKVALPFSFPFYGTMQDTVWVSTNGTITFSNSAPYQNKLIPDATVPNGLIAPLWDDFEYSNDAQVFVGSSSNSVTITYWHLPTHTSPTSYYMTTQVTMFTDGKIIVCFNYDESAGYVNFGGAYEYDCTVGIENMDATSGIQYRACTDYNGESPLYNFVGGPIYDVNGGNLALAFGTDQNDLDWPVAGPGAPTNVAITVAEGATQLSWSAVDGAACYHIYYCETPDGTFELLGTTAETSYTHNVVSGKYFYHVKSDDSGILRNNVRKSRKFSK